MDIKLLPEIYRSKKNIKFSRITARQIAAINRGGYMFRNCCYREGANYACVVYE